MEYHCRIPSIIAMKKFFQNMKISHKLLLSFLCVCLIPLAVISTFLYRFSAKSLEDASMEFASIFNSQIVSSISDFMEEYDRTTKSLLVDEEVIASMSGDDLSVLEQIDQGLYLRKVMLRLVTLKPDIQGLLMISRSGTVQQFHSAGATIQKEQLYEKSWYQEVLESPETLYVTQAHDSSYYDSQQDRVVITVARKIFDYSGQYAGVVLIDLEPSSLVELNDDFLLARTQYNIKISVTNQRGQILYDSDVTSGQITWKQALEESSLLYDKDPEDYIVMSNETRQGGLTVNAVIPRSSLLMKIDKIHYLTVVLVGLCILLTVGVSWMLSRTLTWPLRNLQESMKQVEKGNYQVMLQGENESETGKLVRSYNHMVTRIRTLIENVYLAEIKEKNAKYLALQTQINPHMLYNTLESIRMKALIQGADETAEMIKILSKMFRTALGSRNAMCTVETEIEYTENYMRLQNFRYRDRFSLEIHIPEDIRCQPVIPMIFQPIIENSIEHGFRDHRTALHIAITGAVSEDHKILLHFSDDGKGMTQEQVEKLNGSLNTFDVAEDLEKQRKEREKTSIGLRNIAERIQLQYGENGWLKILSSSDEGTVIELGIPVKASR